MKLSWKYKMVLLMLIAVFGTIAITWVLNKTFLEDYYLYSKIETLDEAYREISEVVKAAEAEGTTKTNEEGKEVLSFSEDKLLELETLMVRNDLTIFLMHDWSAVYYKTLFNNQNYIQFMDRLISYIYPGNSPTLNSAQKLMSVDGKYDIYYVFDKRINSNFLELFYSDAESGNFFLIRTNMESLQENADIANTFLSYAGILVAIVISVLLYFAARSFVRPIEELSGIAKRMSRLDFGVKYEGKAKDEIGELGQSINVLSDRLEETISDLKSANNRLQTDIEQKVQAEEIRKEFLSNVTHELKTPIALIQGYAEGLKDNISEDAQSREFYCDVIIDEASKMNKMVQKLLTLNQLEFGHQMIELERFDITELIRSVLESSEILLKQKDIKLYFSGKTPVYVWADEYMIEEVVTNYLTNAIHHAAEEKAVEIKIAEKEDRVRVSVFNTGSSIAEEELDKIWIKFYKVDKARTREYGGSGIGLSIVKAIMELHNRPYGVINHSNGAEFWFELDASAENRKTEE